VPDKSRESSALFCCNNACGVQRNSAGVVFRNRNILYSEGCPEGDRSDADSGRCQ
jgi:hypothetical protein